MSQNPSPIFEYDPDKPPRTSAIILVVCGLLAVGFVLVNNLFTDYDPYQTDNWGYDDGPIQERGNILPNVWRGQGQEEVVEKPGRPKQRPATRPGLPTPLNEHILKPLTPGTRPAP